MNPPLQVPINGKLEVTHEGGSRAYKKNHKHTESTEHRAHDNIFGRHKMRSRGGPPWIELAGMSKGDGGTPSLTIRSGVITAMGTGAGTAGPTCMNPQTLQGGEMQPFRTYASRSNTSPVSFQQKKTPKKEAPTPEITPQEMFSNENPKKQHSPGKKMHGWTWPNQKEN